MSVHVLQALDLVIGGKAAPPRRRRKLSLASELRQAAKAGLNVTAAMIEPDGRLSLRFGEPDGGNKQPGDGRSLIQERLQMLRNHGKA